MTPRLIRFRTWSKDYAYDAIRAEEEANPDLYTCPHPYTPGYDALVEAYLARNQALWAKHSSWSMRYPEDFAQMGNQFGWSTGGHVDCGANGTNVEAADRIILMQDTGFTAGDTGKALYEGDIVAFTVRGATHGREPDHCAAVHIWWDSKGGQWAFGRWTQKVGPLRGGTEPIATFDWWYTASDDGFDAASLKLLGNVYEQPALVATLGYPL